MKGDQYGSGVAIGSVLWVIGCGMLAAASILVAMSLPIASPDGNGVLAWVQQHIMVLQAADELLSFSALILVMSMLMLYRHLSKKHSVLANIALAFVAIGAVAIVYAMFALGRLIYPVNGLPITSEASLLSASQLFAGLHMAAIMIASCIIVLSIVVGSPWCIVVGVFAAAAQLIGTYYAGPVSTLLAVVAGVVLFLWSVVFGWVVFMNRPGCGQKEV